MRRKKRSADGPNLGTRAFECSKCGHRFEVPWSLIFELHEMTHGYVGYEMPVDFVSCPRCGSESPGNQDDGPAGSEDEDFG